MSKQEKQDQAQGAIQAKRPARRQLKYPMLRKTAAGGNDEKSQISLEMGSEEYREYVRDLAGVDESEFVGASLVTDPEDSRGRRVSDETQAEEKAFGQGEGLEHAENLAAELGAAQEEVAEMGADVLERKYRLRMAKTEQVGEMKETLIEAAAVTETLRDDAIAKKVSTRTVDDLPDITDDAVTPEEYVPLARSRYF